MFEDVKQSDAEFSGRSKIIPAVKSVSAQDIISKRKERDTLKDSDKASISRKEMEQKKKSAEIRNLTNTMLEVRGLIDVAYNIDSTNEVNEKSLFSYFSLQRNIKNKILDKFSIGDMSDELKRSGYALGKHISEMIESGEIRNLDENKISSIVDVITEINGTSTILRELYQETNVSTDTLVNVKCSIFPYAIKIEGVMHQMGVRLDNKILQTRWLHNKSILLAKDIAFNWNKSVCFREREVIFENTLKHCCDISYKTWIELLISGFSSQYLDLQHEDIKHNLIKFNSAFKHRDMGYKQHAKYNEKWLYEQLTTLIISCLKDKEISAFNNRQNGIYFGYLLKLIDAKLAELWVEEDKELVAMFKAMTREEQHKWIKTDEGKNPMSIVRLKSRLVDYISGQMGKEIEIKLDDEILDASASRRFALLWGMSDGICKTKTTQ